MARVTPHHYGYYIAIITIGFPYAYEKIINRRNVCSG
jgi:hypothetical protein